MIKGKPRQAASNLQPFAAELLDLGSAAVIPDGTVATFRLINARTGVVIVDELAATLVGNVAMYQHATSDLVGVDKVIWQFHLVYPDAREEWTNPVEEDIEPNA